MDVKVPALAESVTEGEIGSWLKKDGERVKKDEPLLELQTDKATLEIAAQASGIVRVLREEGETVSVGDVVARIEEDAGGAADAKKPAAPAKPGARDKPEVPEKPAAQEKPAPKKGKRQATAKAGADPEPERPAEQEPEAPAPTSRDETPAPAAREKEAQPAPASAIVHERVAVARGDAAVEVAGAGEAPRPARPAEPGTRRERMTRLRRRIAERLVEAQRTAAILTTFNEIDMTAVQELRRREQEWFTRRHGIKLGFMSLFARATFAALREIPELNASIDGDEIVYHDHVHLGVAVQTDRGLVVPVVRNADDLGLGDLEKEIQRLAERARDGKIALDELEGGTFTITNGGVFGSLLSTPILNPPQTGILGMHAIQQRPIVDADGSIVARPMMYVALSYDHRLIDGKQAVTFLVRLKELLQSPERMLLEA